MEQASQSVRINKYLADKGFATRKEADELIKHGLVSVNGVKAVIGQKIGSRDIVEVRQGRRTAFHYFAYHKVRGVITHSPQQGEEEIPREINLKGKPLSVFPVGRLDKDSSGLIILTNDGRITDRLLNPEYEHSKTYVVTVDKPITKHFLKWMAQGVTIEREVTRPAKIRELSPSNFEITLTEGKKHQIRRMCAALGFQVIALVRISIENILLGSIAAGTWREIAGRERDQFLKKLGL